MPDHDAAPPLRILLVEDDVADAHAVLAMLEAQLDRPVVDVVNDLPGARSAMTGLPDLVLTSLTLPYEDSLELVRVLRTACPDTAVILVSRHDDADFALRAITAGADDVLVKGDSTALVLATSVQHAVQRRRTQAHLHRRERYAASLLDAAESATCALDEEGVIVSTNAPWRAFAESNGGEPQPCGAGVDYLAQCDEASGERCDGAAEVGAGIRAVLTGAVPHFEHEYSCHAPDQQRWFSARVWPQPDGQGVVVSHIDVTAGRLANQEALREQLHDPVTGLPNGQLLHDRLEQLLAEGGRSEQLVAVAVVELEQVASVGLEQGPEARDLLLVEIAERLTGCLHGSGTVGRFGPGRFAIAWGEVASAGDLGSLRARLAHALSEPVHLPGLDLLLKPRVGAAVDKWAQTAEDLLLAATADLDQLVLSPVRLIPPPRQGGARARTEEELRQALGRGELVVHYQPVVDLADGVVVGVEALVRWQHPTDGLLPPAQFIPVAESGGLIVALGTAVLEQACRQGMQWREAGRPLRVSVNLSTRQVAHPDLLRTVQRVLRESRLPPESLVLEVTETAVMADIEAATTVLNAIAALGVSLAIDDFGTGFGPLVYLKRYPVQALKVDRSFVRGMGINATDDAIVESVVGLARAFGGECVAEGVETAEQYVDLVLLGCRFGQGWLFGPAVPAEELPALLERCAQTLVGLTALVPEGAAARDRAGDQRDSAAARRDTAGDDRDDAGDQRDELADRRDVVAGERDVVARERDQAGDRRDRVGHSRDEAGRQRDDVADHRDRLADQRDRDADTRDRAADRRDETREQSEHGSNTSPAQLLLSAQARQDAAADRSLALRDRHAGASERAQAEQDRGVACADRGAGAVERSRAVADRDTALADRGAGADERERAVRDRATAQADRGIGAGQRLRALHDRDGALADRGAAALERHDATFDLLTGTHLRRAGLEQLERDVARAQRTGEALVVAFVDVDGLKTVNDTRGHAAGDQVLVDVAAALRACLRTYDLVFRAGGDEFVCALSGIALRAAERRFADVNARLSGASVSVGLTLLRSDDDLAAVVERADQELYSSRARRHDTQAG